MRQEEKKEEQLYRPATEVCSHLARFLILRTKAWCNDVEFHLETLLPHVIQCHSFQVRADLALLPPHFLVFTFLPGQCRYALSIPVHQCARLLGVCSAHDVLHLHPFTHFIPRSMQFTLSAHTNPF